MPAISEKPYLIDGVLQHYAWGGYSYLTALLGQGNPDRKPTAELWMGAHPKGPAQVVGKDSTLDQIIATAPADLLGEPVANRFDNKLPFLFKILDVRQMLSIQVHPTKMGAEEGFAYEELHGPERTAPTRNYRDNNHKPELGVALTDFYLLHGFKSAGAIKDILQYIPGWGILLPILKEKGVRGLYQHVMEADQDTIDQLLQPLINHLGPKLDYGREYPAFWTHRAVEQYSKGGHHDRGIFSLYWFNIVHLRPGEGIFQDAGIPHAYLQGTCIELMANSDNVLRGGLTPKHIDVPELLKHTSFDEVTPNILSPTAMEDEWQLFETPAPDFALSVAEVNEGHLSVDTSDGPAIIFLLEGKISAPSESITLSESQRIAFVPAGLQLTFETEKKTILYRASVGSAHTFYVPGGVGHHVSDD